MPNYQETRIKGMRRDGLWRSRECSGRSVPSVTIGMTWLTGLIVVVLWSLATPVVAAEPSSSGPQEEHRKVELGEPPLETAPAETPLWHYGGFVDLGYSLDFNFPANHLFQNRSTTPRVNELDLNMGGVYVRKDVSIQSRWGMELLAHGGQDAKEFGFAVNTPRVGSSDQLRHFGRANVSYLAPVGNGLTVQAGLFNSLIGYESLYAKNNFNYTRAWIADYSPYLMFGINASYPFNDKLTGTLFVISEYFHLANSNSLPSYGGQLAYKPTQGWTIKETVYFGPDQADTALKFWRQFLDTIIEWRGDTVTVALEHQIGTENIARVPGSPRAFYTGAAAPVRWNIHGLWSVAVRPEIYWDRNGRLTGFEQLIKAMTTTLEYRVPYKWTNTILRLEHRYDESTGVGGGFFKGNEISPGVIGLTPTQHLLIFSAIWTFDSP
ncbi:MAG: outer membrane beta-barrel protein [Nitrospiraceae bacterium]